MTHPLTEEMMDKIHGDESGYSNPYDEDDMRGAADWQLEQVIAWMRHNLHFTPTSVDYIIQNLKKAMRPTGVLKAPAGTGREGALNALDRLYEENDEGLRRLAQEDS
jgi:hypothetical protein